MMKKIAMFVMIAAPVAAFSQTRLSATQTDKQDPSKKTEMTAATNPETPEVIFGEIIITQNTMGGSVIRLEFGKEGMSSLEDKALIEQIGEARKRQFSNVPDALTFMATLGYKYVSSYTIGEGAKGETHLILEYRIKSKRQERNAGKPVERQNTGEKPVVNDKAPAKK